MAKKSEIKVTVDDARKVLKIVDHGLVCGLGSRKAGQLCVEAAVCLAMGEEHGDRPKCVLDIIARDKIMLNDCDWPGTDARARGLRRLAIAQLVTAGMSKSRWKQVRNRHLILKWIVPMLVRESRNAQHEKRDMAELKRSADRISSNPTPGQVGKEVGRILSETEFFLSHDHPLNILMSFCRYSNTSVNFGKLLNEHLDYEPQLRKMACILVDALREFGSPGVKLMDEIMPPRKKTNSKSRKRISKK